MSAFRASARLQFERVRILTQAMGEVLSDAEASAQSMLGAFPAK
jgi:hypothetical protein